MGGISPTDSALTDHDSDTRITESVAANVLLAGDLTMTGGTTDIAAGAVGKTTASAGAKLEAPSIVLDVKGNVTLTGGDATAHAGGNTAISSASITTAGLFAPKIGGDLTLQGGTAVATPGSGQAASAEAGASLETTGTLNLDVAGKLKLLGGIASADNNAGGTEASASATALLVSGGAKVIDVRSDFIITGGEADARGTNATASAVAGTNPGTTGFAATLNIRTGGDMTLTGGDEFNLGIASAAVLAGGEIKVAVEGQKGLRLIGGSGSNLFQAIPTFPNATLIELQGNAYPITITGGYNRDAGLATGDAFFISGAPPLLLTDPALLRAMDCIAISGGSCVLPATGARAGDPAKQAAGRVCK